MADGTQKNIETAKEGEFVLSFDVEKQKKGKAKICSVIASQNDEICMIKTDKRLIKCTPSHVFWAPKSHQWKAVRPFARKVVDQLKVGDGLLNDSQDYETITSIEIVHLETAMFVYDLSVESPHAFFINGILAHNKQVYIQMEETKSLKNIQPNESVQTLKEKMLNMMSNKSLLENSVIISEAEPENSQILDDVPNEKVVKFHGAKKDPKGVSIEGKLHITNTISVFQTIKTKPLNVGLNETILEMKQHVAMEEGLAVEEQEMIYAGRILEDDRRLSDYNIHNEALIRVCLRSKGMQIYVATFQGRRIQLDVEPQDTISNLKEIIQDKEKLKKDKVSLFYLSQEQELEDEKTLVDYKISHNAFLTLKFKEIQLIEVYIQPQKGDRFPLKLSCNQTIAEVKQMIEENKEGVLTEDQCLLFTGENLLDNKKVSEYPIYESSTIYLIKKNKDLDLENSLLMKFEISVKTPWGKVIGIQANAYCLIGVIKNIICKMENLYYYQDLVLNFKGTPLLNQSCLISNRISKGDCLELKLRKHVESYLLDIILKKELFKMNIYPENTISELKQMVSLLTKVPSNQIGFLHNNSILWKDNWLISNCFPTGSQVLVVLSYEGGASISLTEAISDIPFKDLAFLEDSLKILPNAEIKNFFKECKQNLADFRKTHPKAQNLRDDELAVLNLWNREIIYKDLNKILIKNADLSSWKYFLKCFCSGIKKLPRFKGKAFIGLSHFEENNSSILKKDSFISFQNITALSKSPEIALKMATKQGILFEIEIISSRDVSSVFDGNLDQSILLEPYSLFLVEGVEKKAGGPTVVKLKEISVPRGFKVVFWVDDNPEYNYKYADDLESKSISVVLSTSTKEALTVISLYRWLLYFPNSAFKIVTDMTRLEEGVENKSAGLDLIEQLCMRFQYSFGILCFCGNKVQAEINSEARQLKGNFKIANSEKDLNEFLVFA